MSPAQAKLRPLPGPIPTPAGAYDLGQLGYVEEEFVLEGVADSYEPVGERSLDGRWSVRTGETAPFVTRILVRRPADGTQFSGTVVVEWLNVSGGLDAPPIWMMTHTQLIRRLHAWVGVSAQRAGLEGGGLTESFHLKKAFPNRYAVLSHPGDAWSFDMFSQAGRAVPGALGPLVPRRLLAAGQSQSAAFLVTYINAIDAAAEVYDGFAVLGRMASGASLQRGFIPPSRDGGPAPAELIRSDLRVPVLVLQTETDVTMLGSGRVGQPDSDLLRNWELAGAAHADSYLLVASGQDDGALPAAKLAELTRPTTNLFFDTTELPINSGLQHHYVACAALEHLDSWAAGVTVPPIAPRLHPTADWRDFIRDATGIATGGIRTPWVDAPTAVLSGVGQPVGATFAFLFGVTRSFEPEQIASLYPGGPADYLTHFEKALDTAINAGFLLTDDRSEALAVAEAAWPG